MPEINCPNCGHRFSATKILSAVCPECGQPVRMSRKRPEEADQSPPRVLKRQPVKPAAEQSDRERIEQLRQEVNAAQEKVQELESKTTITAKTKKSALVGKIATIKKQIEKLEGKRG